MSLALESAAVEEFDQEEKKEMEEFFKKEDEIAKERQSEFDAHVEKQVQQPSSFATI